MISPEHPIEAVLATGNAHKVAEFSRLLDGAKAAMGARRPVHRFLSAETLGGMPEVPENTGTFCGNARQKAQALRALAPPPFWVLADDSGLCCEALGGAPGVASARFAGPQASDAANRAKLLEALKGIPLPGRKAHFLCQLCLISPEAEELSLQGRCDGVILETEHGEGGFGYDSIFLADGCKVSFAALPPGEKDRLSHRGRAVAALLAALNTREHKGTF